VTAFGSVEVRGAPGRMHADPPENLVGQEIAEAGRGGWAEEHGLDAGLPACQGVVQFPPGDAGRIRTEARRQVRCGLAVL
jgi:hypothetical protein